MLFADVAGFTTLAEQLDPEIVHDLINRCFERITTEVHRFEGTINHYTGVRVMALFGVPMPHEDSSRRAPTRAFEVLWPRGHRTRFDVAVERGLTPLVSRERELATLHERFGEVKAGRGQVVGIGGEAGMGKACLMLEFRRALALAHKLGMRPLVAHCHRGLGTLYATLGRQEPARLGLSAAIELYRAMDMTFWLPQAEAALAQVEGR